MEVLLVRHAIATERTASRPDAERPLTGRGVKRFRAAVRGLQRLELHLDHVFHSPWLRAAQTAELLAPVLAAGPHAIRSALELTDLLADSPGDPLLALARPFPAGARVGFVGHEPWMSELLSLLLTGTTDHAGRLPFKKGGVAWLEGEPGPAGMGLRAMLPPRTLRRLGKPS